MLRHCSVDGQVVFPCQLVMISARTLLVSTTLRAAVRPARVSLLSAGGALFTFGSPPDTVDNDNVVDLSSCLRFHPVQLAYWQQAVRPAPQVLWTYGGTL